MSCAAGGKAIVFTKTKAAADEVAAGLSQTLPCEALHGDIAQAQREVALRRYREGQSMVLVATDVAARGLDIPNVEVVLHYDLPQVGAQAGRGGRAAKRGEGGCPGIRDNGIKSWGLHIQGGEHISLWVTPVMRKCLAKRCCVCFGLPELAARFSPSQTA